MQFCTMCDMALSREGSKYYCSKCKRDRMCFVCNVNHQCTEILANGHKRYSL